MAYFNSLDLGIIILYLAGIIGLGVWVGGKQTNLKDYFLGSGQVPWWVSGLSIVATETSAVTFISIPALAFGGDISFLQVVLGYLVARVLLASFVVPLYFKGEIYSPYQLLGDRFGMSAQKMVAFLFLMAGVLAAGVRVYVTCIPLQLMFGLAESQIIIVILFFVIASLVYTLIGGVKAVVWTDAVQFFVFTFGGVFALCFAVYHIDGGWGNAVAQASEGGKLLWFRTGFEGESKPFITSLFSGSLNIWMGVIGAAFLAFSSHGADQLIVQRVLACGNAADGRKAMVLSAVVISPSFCAFLVCWSRALGLLPSQPGCPN